MKAFQLANQDSGKEDWTTPRRLFDQLDAVFHFTLDPCSNDENALCEKHYTEETDGLSQDWGQETVFMNPPYSREIGKWIEKAFQSERSCCGVSDPGTAGFTDVA